MCGQKRVLSLKKWWDWSISVTDTVKKTKVVMKKEHDILMMDIINLPKQASIELKWR